MAHSMSLLGGKNNNICPRCESYRCCIYECVAHRRNRIRNIQAQDVQQANAQLLPRSKLLGKRPLWKDINEYNGPLCAICKCDGEECRLNLICNNNILCDDCANFTFGLVLL